MSFRDRLRKKPTQTSTPPAAPAAATSPSRPTNFDPAPYIATSTSLDSGHSSSTSHCDTSSSSSSSSCDSGSY
ncbi:hypothetical protein ACFVH9_07405 [Streptomyces hirsutus]|uniref:hypothetical protein n=1 Tax=Streptomyces hirsutus TaxID=35620 RepID=UPI00363A9282